MALVLADRVKDSTTTTGQGTVTLSGTAPTGYQNFSIIGNGNTTYYTIAGGSEWEVGIGTYTSSGTTLSRDTVLSSSAGGTTKVTFSAGTKDVFVTLPAEKTPTVAYTRTSFTATAGQTTFTVSYTVGLVSVYLNGVFLNETDYTATNGTSVVLVVAAALNDIVEVIAYSTVGASGGMVYPSAGIANSTGTAWGTSYTTTGTGTVVALATSPTLTTPVISSIVNTGTLTLPTSTDTLVGRATTDTLTNKRVTPRANFTTSTTSPWAINSDSYDTQGFTALANALTISADAGTPTQGQKMMLRFKDNATPRVLTFTGGVSKGFRPIGVTMTTSGSDFTYTTTASKDTYFGCIYNTDAARWDIVAIAQEA